jgi:hypothetical protein
MNNAKDRNKVFVLGAGFSAHAGYPLVRGLRKAVLEHMQNDPEGRYFWCKRWREEFAEGLNAADFAVSTAGKNPENCFEELLLHLSVQKATDSAAMTTNRILRCATGRFLWKLNSRELPIEYKNFVSHAKRAIGLISFNWDVLVESALWQTGTPWGYKYCNAPLPLIKPHGSINWSSHEQQGTTGGSMWQELFPGSGLCWIPPRSSDDKSTIPDPAFQDPFDDCSNSDLNYMLFPGDPDSPEATAGDAISEKAVSDRRALWEHACLLIGRSDEVVFLGYSLPGYDDYAVKRLRIACTRKQVVVVNPCSYDAEEIKRNLGSCIEVEIKLQRFEDSEYARKVL